MGKLTGFYKISALLLIVVSIVLIAVGLGASGESKTGLIFTGGTLLFVAVVFFFVGKFISSVGGAAVKDGMPAAGEVLGVRDTGVTIGGLNAVMAVQVRVRLAGSAPYDAEFKIALGRHQWGAIQPGMTVPIQVERSDHSKIAYDETRAMDANAIAGGGAADVIKATGTRMNASEMATRGVATRGTLSAVTPVGITAGEVADGLPAHEADDPMVKIAMTYAGPMGETKHFEFIARVPDGKAGYLAAGADVPVRYLPEDPNVATIDWDRF